MSEEQQRIAGDLCQDEAATDIAIKLYNKVFGFKEENTQTFFFPAGEILKILSADDCIGINVCPALDDNPPGNDIFITIVLKPLRLEDVIDKTLVKKEPNAMLRPGDPASCCPTPGFPVAGTRKEKLEHWIEEIKQLELL